jgi:hypothetical protein
MLLLTSIPLFSLTPSAQRKKLGKKETPEKEFRRLRTATTARALDRRSLFEKATQKLLIGSPPNPNLLN